MYFILRLIFIHLCAYAYVHMCECTYKIKEGTGFLGVVDVGAEDWTQVL